MTAIKITPANAARIQALLADANGRATSHTICSCAVVIAIADAAEERLSALPKKERVGASLTHTPAGPWASAYKYAAQTTCLRMERRASGWFLTSAERAEVYPRAPQRDSMTITPEQRDEIARRAVAEFSISEAVA